MDLLLCLNYFTSYFKKSIKKLSAGRARESWLCVLSKHWIGFCKWELKRGGLESPPFSYSLWIDAHEGVIHF